MQKESIAQKSVYWLKVISLGLILGIGIQIAQAWTPPGANPPGGNISGPITTSATAQTKNGPLTVKGIVESNAGGAKNGGAFRVGSGGMLHSWGNNMVFTDINGDYYNSVVDVGYMIADTVLITPRICLLKNSNYDCITSWPTGGGGGGGGGGADNLGNHTATTDLNMSSKQINSLAAPTVGTDAATKAYVDGNSMKVFSRHGVTPTICEGTDSGGGLCNGAYYVDITFPSSFSSVPDVIVTPELTSNQGGCVGFATDQVKASPSNITKTGFRLYANGSVVGNGCGASYEGWSTYASAGWMAIGK